MCSLIIIVYSFYRTDGDILELIMINSEKIKIMLTREDMTKYNIHMYSLGHTGSAIKEAFGEVLSDIKTRTGFDTLSSKTILQVYPSRDGGCEVYITRLKNDLKLKNGEKHECAGQSTNITVKRWLEKVIFSFEKLTDTIDACRLLYLSGYDKSSSLYLCDDTYYLFLETEIKPKGRYDELTSLCDFGKRLECKITQAFICEHGELIVPDRAVEALAL